MSNVRTLVLAVSVLLPAVAAAAAARAAPAAVPEKFEPLLGWWIGTGYIFFREGKREEVKCRATYVWEDAEGRLRQAVRCASQSGKVEVKSELAVNDAGQLSGEWSETTHNLAGTLEGAFDGTGFRVKVAGDTVKANMAVIVRTGRQIVEIQFHGGVLVGLTMIFNRG